ncbi:hypothetical protein, partial [uncultured Campylobacter sp.]|uniref:hypothetical protein n=1 Tax=uncultured Campylobacter sp. TaxID=218934 RepID=UPI0026234AFC
DYKFSHFTALILCGDILPKILAPWYQEIWILVKFSLQSGFSPLSSRSFEVRMRRRGARIYEGFLPMRFWHEIERG